MYGADVRAFWKLQAEKEPKDSRKSCAIVLAGFASGPIGLGYTVRYRYRKVLGIRWTC